jgi:uncharacterized protein (TIGR03083 family)
MDRDMSRDEIWRAIDAQRLSVAELLDDLSDEEWSTPSLCAGWTVRDVAAHLTLQQIGPRQMVSEFAQAPRLLFVGGMNSLIRELARRHATKPTDQIIAGIRATVGSRRHNFGVTHLETLIDVLVHSQDIALPLGRRLDMPPAAAAAAATRVWQSGWPFHPRKKLRGFQLTATDTTWSAGQGLAVNGPIAELLLVLTGRRTAATELTGDL